MMPTKAILLVGPAYIQSYMEDMPGSNIQQVVQGIMSSIEPLKMNFLGG